MRNFRVNCRRKLHRSQCAQLLHPSRGRIFLHSTQTLVERALLRASFRPLVGIGEQQVAEYSSGERGQNNFPSLLPHLARGILGFRGMRPSGFGDLRVEKKSLNVLRSRSEARKKGRLQLSIDLAKLSPRSFLPRKAQNIGFTWRPILKRVRTRSEGELLSPGPEPALAPPHLLLLLAGRVQHNEWKKSS